MKTCYIISEVQTKIHDFIYIQCQEQTNQHGLTLVVTNADILGN